MKREQTLVELLNDRHWNTAMFALGAGIDDSTASRIIKGHARPRGSTAVRAAEALGIGYSRMRRVLDATWEAAHPVEQVGVPAR